MHYIKFNQAGTAIGGRGFPAWKWEPKATAATIIGPVTFGVGWDENHLMPVIATEEHGLVKVKSTGELVPITKPNPGFFAGLDDSWMTTNGTVAKKFGSLAALPASAWRCLGFDGRFAVWAEHTGKTWVTDLSQNVTLPVPPNKSGVFLESTFLTNKFLFLTRANATMELYDLELTFNEGYTVLKSVDMRVVPGGNFAKWTDGNWLIYEAESLGQIVCHSRINEKVGYKLGFDIHNIDAWWNHEDNLDIVYAFKAGAQASNARRITIDPGLGMVSLVPEVVVPIPVWKPSSALSYVMTFYEPENQARYTLAERIGSVTAKTRGVFWTMNRGSDPEDYKRFVAEQHNLPIYAFHDADSPFPVETLLESDIPVIKAYPIIGQTAAQIAARVKTRIKELKNARPGLPIALALAFFRQIKGDLKSYSWSMAQVQELNTLLAPIIVDEGIHTVLCFAWMRAAGLDGVIAFPEFQTSLAALQASAKGPDTNKPIEDEVPIPEPDPEPVPSPETVTVLNDEKLRKLSDKIADVVLAHYPSRDHKAMSDEADAIGRLMREVPRNSTAFEMALAANFIGYGFDRDVMDAIRVAANALDKEFLQ